MIQMRYNPATGEEFLVGPHYPDEFRQYHGPVVWLYDPWTGEARDPRDVGTDPLGNLIQPTVDECGSCSDCCHNEGLADADREYLLDQFAGLTLQGMYASGVIREADKAGVSDEINMAAAAMWAYDQAEAMLAERARRV